MFITVKFSLKVIYGIIPWAWKVVSSDLPDCTGSELNIFYGWEDCFPPSHPAALTVLYQLYVSIVTPAQLPSSMKSSHFAPFGM